MKWKDPIKEPPLQSLPLLVIRKNADLAVADGGVDIAYVDDFGFQCNGSKQTVAPEDIEWWCYIDDILEKFPLPYRFIMITNDKWVDLAAKNGLLK